MNVRRRSFRWSRRWTTGLVLGVGGVLCHSEVIVLETRTNSMVVTPCPPYCEVAGNWANSSIASTAPGTTVGRPGSRFATDAGASFSIRPTLAYPYAECVYQVDITHPGTASVSPDIVVSISTSGGSGLPATTDAFQQAHGSNQWYCLGLFIPDGTTNRPTFTFTQTGGQPGRFYADAIRFTSWCPCNLPPVVIGGPLAAGQEHVDVSGVATNATNVSVFNSTTWEQLGERSDGLVPGANRVPTLPLVKGTIVAAIQSSPICQSMLPASGPTVGGGANPPLRVSLCLRDSAPPHHVIGSDGGADAGPRVFLKATGLTGGYGTAPTGGAMLDPSCHWRSVTFWREQDPACDWNGSTVMLTNDFAVLDGLALAIADTDTGPYELYLDTLANGTTVIQDFESAAPGEMEVLVNQPSTSTATRAYLLSPVPATWQGDLSVVVNTNADAGNHCLRLEWQFLGEHNASWLHAQFQGSRTPNPVVDLRQPVSVRLLLLPPGQSLSPGKLHVELAGEWLVLNWSGSFQLQRATNACGPFEDLIGINRSPFSNQLATAQAQFFRLRQ